eukprot:2485399-Pyramimonas_sp.AAC.1
MSDGWGCKISDSKTALLGEHVLRRTGRVRAEFLLEKSIVKTISPSGEIRSAMRFEAPRGLGQGKTGWHMLQAAVDHEETLRQHVHDGVVITFVLQDGLHFAGMSRRMEARCDLFYDALDDPSVSTDPHHPLRLSDWFFGMRCIAHVASSAISWGMSEVSTKQLLDDIHIGIKSCRDTSNELFQVVFQFVCSAHVVFEDPPEQLARRQEFWEVMGVPETLMEDVML